MPKREATRCVVCREGVKSPFVYRLRRLDGKDTCDVCLQTVVAPVSPSLLMDYLNDGEVVYEDKDKENDFLNKYGDGILEEEQQYFSDQFGMTESKSPKEVKKLEVKKPQEIFDHLNKFVIGQDHAKKVISVAAYNHFKRINNGLSKKSNVLMMGPTGCGKTYIATLLSKLLDLPFAISDANSITQSGYVGGDVEDILENLYLKADKDLELAQKGIVLIDEIDKISSKDENGGRRDITGRGVQEALLKIIEGGEFKVDIGSGQSKESILFDTTNVLFIVSGAFVDIKEIIDNKNFKANKGFLGNESKLSEDEDQNSNHLVVTNEDLENFGLIPELIGRLQVRTVLDELTEEDLVKIMKSSKDSITKHYKDLLKLDGVSLRITIGALSSIARNAVENKTGARGLQNVFETLLLDTMFSAPTDDQENKSFSLTKSRVEDLLKENSDGN